MRQANRIISKFQKIHKFHYKNGDLLQWRRWPCRPSWRWFHQRRNLQGIFLIFLSSWFYFLENWSCLHKEISFRDSSPMRLLSMPLFLFWMIRNWKARFLASILVSQHAVLLYDTQFSHFFTNSSKRIRIVFFSNKPFSAVGAIHFVKSLGEINNLTLLFIPTAKKNPFLSIVALCHNTNQITLWEM